MAIVNWVANAQNTSQIVTITVAGVANGATLTATINGGTIVYTCTGADTTTTATTAWFALLNASTTPPEYQEIAFANPSAGVVTATAKVPGTPFAGMTGGLTTAATGGASVSQSITTPNSSESSVAQAQNWRRNGVAALPQDNDDMVIADSDTSLLWDLDALAAVRLASKTRYQTFTASIGLPENSPNGYLEFRPTYFKLFGGGVSGVSSSSSPSSGGTPAVLNVVLGFGGGTGPQRERYDFQGQQVAVSVLASGQPNDTYSIRLLGSNPANTLSVLNTSVGVAMSPAETAALASATVGAGGVLSLGPSVTFAGTLTVTNGAAAINCYVGNVVAQGSSQIYQGTVGSNLKINYGSFAIKNASALTWLSGSNIASLVLQTSSQFSKPDLRPMAVTDLSIEVDSCLFNDTNGVVSFVNPVQLVNALQSGPFRFPAGKTFRIA